MSKTELNSTVKKARRLKVKIEALQAEYDSLTGVLKDEMDAAGVEVMTGSDWKITYTTVRSNRIDTTAFKKALPELAEKFTKLSIYKRFAIN